MESKDIKIPQNDIATNYTEKYLDKLKIIKKNLLKNYIEHKNNSINLFSILTHIEYLIDFIINIDNEFISDYLKNKKINNQSFLNFIYAFINTKYNNNNYSECFYIAKKISEQIESENDNFSNPNEILNLINKNQEFITENKLISSEDLNKIKNILTNNFSLNTKADNQNYTFKECLNEIKAIDNLINMQFYTSIILDIKLQNYIKQ